MANSVLLRIEVDRVEKFVLMRYRLRVMTSRQIKRSMKNTRERVKFELGYSIFQKTKLILRLLRWM